MGKYKITAIGHLLKNNKVAKFGEEVDESQLTSSAKDLVEQGFIKEVEVGEIETKIEEEKVIILDPEKEEEKTEIGTIEENLEVDQELKVLPKNDEIKNSLKK